jgi:hypothetical protein
MFGRTIVKISTLIEYISRIERLGAESRFRDSEIARLLAENVQYHAANAKLIAEFNANAVEELQLHKATVAARTMCDMLRVELNASREKEAALLAQLMPTLKMAVPKLETDDGLFAGTGMYDDMGDREAARHGFSDAIPLGTPKVPSDPNPSEG